MKKNGLTLVELLAALAVSGLVLTIVTSIFLMGIKQGVISKSEVSLQQEANYVASRLRKEYLSESAYNESTKYILTVSDNQIVLNGTVISDQYHYNSTITYEGHDYSTNEEVAIKSSSPLMIQITLISGDKSYTLRTTLSRGV